MKALGTLFIIIGSFFIMVTVFGTVSDLGKESADATDDTLAGVFGGLFIALPCLFLGRHFIRKSKEQNAIFAKLKTEMASNIKDSKSNTHVNVDTRTDNSIEKTNYEIKLIKLAREKDGYISCIDVVLELNISSKKAQSIIDELYAEGLFDIHLTKNGSTLYRLRNYCSSEDRQTATSLLD